MMKVCGLILLTVENAHVISKRHFVFIVIIIKCIFIISSIDNCDDDKRIRQQKNNFELYVCSGNFFMNLTYTQIFHAPHKLERPVAQRRTR